MQPLAPIDYLIPCLAAIAGGAINSLAGGGTLLTFPALYAVLGATPQASVIANATSTLALVPGSAAGMVGYWRELRPVRRWAWLLLGPSLVGGCLGALLVTQLDPRIFRALVPWLILTAALLFALQPTLSRFFGIGHDDRIVTLPRAAGVAFFQLLIAIYGGYFGAGIGILMLSGLALMGLSDIHAMNGLKTLLAVAINGISVLIFVASGVVHWPLALSMAVASIIGGYAGARLAVRLNRRLVRHLVVAIGFGLASYYFWKQATATPTPADAPPPAAPIGVAPPASPHP
jgi:uncharacterized membrane protein YfcA